MHNAITFYIFINLIALICFIVPMIFEKTKDCCHALLCFPLWIDFLSLIILLGGGLYYLISACVKALII
jgi:hypothetical protein